MIADGSQSLVKADRMSYKINKDNLDKSRLHK